MKLRNGFKLLHKDGNKKDIIKRKNKTHTETIDERMWEWGKRHNPPIFSDLQESWSSVSHAAREFVTVTNSLAAWLIFLVAIVGHLVKNAPPPNGRCLGIFLTEICYFAINIGLKYC